MYDLGELIDWCNLGVTLTVNEHRAKGMTAKQVLDSLGVDEMQNLDQEVADEMIRRNVVISIRFCQCHAEGWRTVMHYDLESAIADALSSIYGDNEPQNDLQAAFGGLVQTPQG